MKTPFCSENRPTIDLLARSTTSTILPSRRPRRSAPVIQTTALSPCSTCRICLLPRYTSPLLSESSAIKKPNPSGWADMRPMISAASSTGTKPCFLFSMSCPSRSIAFTRRFNASSCCSSLASSSLFASASKSIGACSFLSVVRINSRLATGWPYLAFSLS